MKTQQALPTGLVLRSRSLKMIGTNISSVPTRKILTMTQLQIFGFTSAGTAGCVESKALGENFTAKSVDDPSALSPNFR